MAVKTNTWGFKLLGILLLLEGLQKLFGLHFNGMGTVMGVLALLAGILIIIDQ